MVKTGDNNPNKILGSTGADTLDGAGANDTILGSGGNDLLIGSGGADSIDGGAGNDILNGGAENDVLIGGTGNDVLTGDTGNDTLKGGDGTDKLDGGIGDDSMEGGGSNDLYIVNSIRDKVIETSALKSVDTVESSVTFTLPNLVEHLSLTGLIDLNGTGNKLNNKITGNNADNKLTGLDGQDTLIGGEGADTLDGGTGVDSLVGGGDDDLYIITSSGDKVVEVESGGDEDEVTSTVDFTLANHVEVLTLMGESNLRGAGNNQDNILNGNSGANELSGNGGNDTILANEGDDRIDGDKGDDEIDGGDGNDVATYAGIFDGYQITFDEEGQSYIIEDIDDSDGNEGMDILVGVESVEFTDQVVELTTASQPSGEMPMMSIGDVTKPEGTGSVSTAFDFPVTLSAASDTEITVDYAVQGNGVTASTGTLTFAAGETEQFVSVAVAADSVDEPDQTFTVQLGNAVGAELEKSQGTGTIQDDDDAPTTPTVVFDGLDFDFTDENDYFSATEFNDRIGGAGGNDTLDGLNGNDSLTGGAGDDYLYGGEGNDSLVGSEGNDTLYGSNGNDSLNGSAGNDYLDGEYGSDTLSGSAGADTLKGGSSYDDDVTDRFVFNIGDSGVGAGNRNILDDFRYYKDSYSKATAVIDLSNLSATPLTFKVPAVFDGANQVIYKVEGGRNTVVQVNLDANTSTVEMEIEITGIVRLVASDFDLS